jgi:hypothetical protein
MDPSISPSSVSREHVRGFRWFSALARVAAETSDSGVGLHQSLQLYSMYAQTGDVRYLKLCENFLKLSLDG